MICKIFKKFPASGVYRMLADGRSIMNRIGLLENVIMADRELKKIALAAIRENPSALRAVNRQDVDYLGLVDSIKNRGVLNPIVVRELTSDNGDTIYGLVDGLHRYSGSLDAGLKEIPAQVINMSDGEVMEAQLTGNVHKIETKPVEYSKLLQKILAINPLRTMSELAARLNKSTTWLSERLRLTELHPSVQPLVDDGKINLSNAYLLAKLPKEEQLNFTDRAQTMTPQEFMPTVLTRKKEIDTAKRQGRDPKSAEFVPVPYLRKVSELREEMDHPQLAGQVCSENSITTPEDGFSMGVRWALHMDPASVAVAKAKDDARKAEDKEKKMKAAAERARMKAEEAARNAAAISEPVGV